MAETIYKVVLADGTELTGLTCNGNNFISSKPIERSTFENNMSPVIISSGNDNELHDSMDLVHLTVMEDKTWFALRDLTVSELAAIKTRSDIDYIAMMCDVDL